MKHTVYSAWLVMQVCSAANMEHNRGNFATAWGEGVFKVESPFGTPVSGMALSLIEPIVSDQVVTGDDGRAILEIPPDSSFVVKGVKPPLYQDLYIFGVSPASNGSSSSSPSFLFNYTTYMGTRAEAKALAEVMGLPYDESKGYIVVGMDDLKDPADGLAPSNLIPAVGASSLLEGIDSSAEPFIFDLRPTQGVMVTNTSSSFVTYPLMDTDEVGTSFATPPTGQTCLISPSLTDLGAAGQKVAAYPDSISVVSFVCVDS
jgi:hypothetical protein